MLPPAVPVPEYVSLLDDSESAGVFFFVLYVVDSWIALSKSRSAETATFAASSRVPPGSPRSSAGVSPA